MDHQQLHVVVRREDGVFWATVAEFPGVFATGETLEELRESLEEGVSLWLTESGSAPRRIVMGELSFSEPLQAHADLEYA